MSFRIRARSVLALSLIAALVTFELLANIARAEVVNGIPMDVVAYFDQTAPGTNQLLKFFPQSNPAIDNQGRISFGGYAGTSSNQGLWSGPLGQISLVALPGSIASGTGGQTFTSLSLTDVEQAGPLSYAGAFTTASGGTQRGNWIHFPAQDQLVVDPNASVPGEPTSARFKSAPVVAVTPQGQYAFFTGLTTDTGTQGGIWANLNGTLAMIGHQGLHAAGFPSGVTWTNIFSYPTISPAGQALFYGSLSNGLTGLFASNGASSTTLGASGQPVPGLGSTTFGQVDNQQLHPNSAGDLAFYDGSIWLKNASGYHRVAQVGSAIIGGGTLTSLSADVHVADDDRVIFTGGQAGGVFGLYYAGADGIHVIARNGMAVPGQPAGTTFTSVYPAQANDLGQVAFLANFQPQGGFTSYNNIFATDLGGALHLIAGPGTTVSLPGRPSPYVAGNADMYIATDVELTQLNNSGDLVFTLGAASGGGNPDIIMVAHTVPEPGAIVLMGIGLALLLAAQGRRASTK